MGCPNRCSAFTTQPGSRSSNMTAPTTRLSCLRAATGPSRLVWTLHHILMDGRAFILVLDEVERHYRALRAGAAVDCSPGLPYRPYIDWTSTLDLTGAAEFWRTKLAGLTAPTPLPLDNTALPFGSAASPGGAGLVDNTALPFGSAASPGGAGLVDNTALPFGSAASPGGARLVDAQRLLNWKRARAAF